MKKYSSALYTKIDGELHNKLKYEAFYELKSCRFIIELALREHFARSVFNKKNKKTSRAAR